MGDLRRLAALLMFDPEGRGGLGVSHVVTYGIPAAGLILRFRHPS